MSRFDQIKNKPYGHVTEDPTIVFHTEAESDEWGSNNPGQSVDVTNPSRENRIENRLYNILDEAIEEAFDDIQDHIDNSRMTEQEVNKFIPWIDIRDSWEIWQANNQ